MNQNYRILIADDEEIGRLLLEAALKEENYDLFFAQNGSEVLKLTTQYKPDLILLDVMMPEYDGFQVCQRIRNMPELNNTIIFLVTALDDRDSRRKGLEAGADEFISKPYSRSEVLDKIRHILKRDNENGRFNNQSSSDHLAFPDIDDQSEEVNLNFSDSFNNIFINSGIFIKGNINHADFAGWCGQINTSNHFILLRIKGKEKQLQNKVNRYLISQISLKSSDILNANSSNLLLHYLNEQIIMLRRMKLIASSENLGFVHICYNPDMKEITISGLNEQVLIVSKKPKKPKFDMISLHPENILRFNPEKIVYFLSGSIIHKVGKDTIIIELHRIKQKSKAAFNNLLTSLIRKTEIHESVIAIQFIFN